MIRTAFALAGGIAAQQRREHVGVSDSFRSPIAEASSHRVLGDAFAWLHDPESGA